jgi:hypothetical protein
VLKKFSITILLSLIISFFFNGCNDSKISETNTCVQMMDIISDDKYTNLKVNYCEYWTMIEIKEKDSILGLNPTIRIIEREKINKLIETLEKTLSLFEEIQNKNLKIQNEFNVYEKDLKDFISVNFDSTNENIEIKISLITKDNSNFFIINDKNKLFKIIEELQNTQKNGINKLNEIKQLVNK